MDLDRRDVLSAGAAALAISVLPGCNTPPTTVRVLVAVFAHEGETVAEMKTRVFADVSIDNDPNLAAKVGWLTWSYIDSDFVLINRDYTLSAEDMITAEGERYTQRPEEWFLVEGEVVAFFRLDCRTIAVARGGEEFVELAGDYDIGYVVILRDGRVLERVDFGEIARAGDELVVYHRDNVVA